MNRKMRKTISVLIYIIGLTASIYIGGWIMIVKPIRSAIAAQVMGTLTLHQLIVTLIKCICSTTVAGLIWIIGYVVSNRVFDERDEM